MTFAAIMAYTTRYYINGDAIAYVEMGEALRKGSWAGLVNLTYSPGYPVLLGIAQALLKSDPMTEIQLLRFVNFACFLGAMGGCDALVSFVRRELPLLGSDTEKPFPEFVLSALCYSMFLVASLVFVRMRLLNPDMLVFAVVVAATVVLLWIRSDPADYVPYAALGVVTGTGYLVKSFFFPFSPVFFALAGLCSPSLRKAVPRVAVAVLVMLIVSAPLIASLSSRLGRFSYSELGRHVYATMVSGKGEPIHTRILNRTPEVKSYEYAISCTRPSGFDICYWHEGLEPDFNLRAHARIIPGNIVDIFVQTPWLWVIPLWYLGMCIAGSWRVGGVRPPSVFVLLFVPGILGIAFYCLIRMEPRYIAPYLFLGFVALTVSLRIPAGDRKVRRLLMWLSGVLVAFFLLMVTHSLVDQSLSGLFSNDRSPSYKAKYEEHVALRDFLKQNGLKHGDRAAVIGEPPVYWGRMAGLRIVAEVENEEQFLTGRWEERTRALQSLKAAGVKAVVAKGPAFGKLTSEGWKPAPGTRDYFVRFLDDRAG